MESGYSYIYSERFKNIRDIFFHRISIYKITIMILLVVGAVVFELSIYNKIFYSFFVLIFILIILIKRLHISTNEFKLSIFITPEGIEVKEREGGTKLIKKSSIDRVIYVRSTQEFTIVYSELIPKDLSLYKISEDESKSLLKYFNNTVEIKRLDTPMG
ncbi:MAG: hypothetical protein CME66_00460 [Halobacteriovoraceae bacterium]|nr:hypothetical protein [Halobacteriovoraceae bacterium]